MLNAAWLNRGIYLLSNIFILREELSSSFVTVFNVLAGLSLVCIYLLFSVLLQIAFDWAKLQRFKYHLSHWQSEFLTMLLENNSNLNILNSERQG